MSTQPAPVPLAHTCQECDAPTPELFWKNPADRSASPVMICEICWYLNGTPVRDLMTAAGAGDAPIAVLAALADAYRQDVINFGHPYAIVEIEVITQLTADAWHRAQAEHGPRATWTRGRGYHAADIDEVTR